MELSNFSIILALILTLLLAFVLIPALFNAIASLWYYRINSGPDGFKKESMIYDAENDKIIPTDMPIH